MDRSHPVFEDAKLVRPEQILWRYLDLAKFVSLLQSSALYFCRSDLLGDPYEGSFGKAVELNRERWRVKLLGEGETDESIDQMFWQSSEMPQSVRKCMFINCWQMGEAESMAMWKGYGNGVAICTTYKQLDEELPELAKSPDGHEKIFISPVRYEDYGSTEWNMPHSNNLFAPFVYKSHAYANEKELRAVFWEPTNGIFNSVNYQSFIQRLPPLGDVAFGREVKVNLHQLINKVIVSPLVGRSFLKNVVTGLRDKYGYNFEVAVSSNSGPPIY